MPESESASPIFALDIGTRTIVGILAYPEEEQLKITACEIFEHKERSMLDGQIHDVLKVADIIKKIKQQIEEQTGTVLTHAAVAAAGRSLKTIRTKISRSIKDHPFSSREQVVAFELEAVQQAQKKLLEEHNVYDKTSYHCVGYSVVEYTLDDSPIGSIVDQYGEHASIDVIATFLPRIVVDSLESALQRADLQISALTLEPIAAINVLIPSTMRKLNIALVDIGAGTSDIALTADGTITGYAMVPTAGDEITEAISQTYLLDFNVAELLKRSLHQGQVTYQDVLGFEYEKTSQEVISDIRDSINLLASKIAEKILDLNKQPPQAVMLVGGGSMTPMLPELVAHHLHLPKERVAVRGAEAIKNLIGEHQVLRGPEAVTPIGIALSAKLNHIDFMNIHVNGKRVRVFDLKKVTVGDALLASGIDMNKLHGKPGLALSIEVNGNLRILRGQLGSPATILINGRAANLETQIYDGDQLSVEAGQAGQNAVGTVKDILTPEELTPLQITYNNQPKTLDVILSVNGKPSEIDQPLQDRDQIIVHPPSTVKECLIACGLTQEDLESKSMTVYLNDQAKTLPGGTHCVFVNGNPAAMYTKVSPNDMLTAKILQKTSYTIYNIIEPEQLFGYEVTVNVNGNPLVMQHPGFKLLKNDQPATPDSPIEDRDRIEIVRNPEINLMFNDIFKYLDIMAERPDDCTRLQMLLNDNPATFDSPIKTGDVIYLQWQA